MMHRMSTDAESLSLARVPQQSRGRERFEKILAAAEALLRQRGPSGLSIPELAERLGYTRTSIYHFFPTPYAVLNELTRRSLLELEQEIQRRALEVVVLDWRAGVERIVTVAAAFLNERPVARMLILGGSATDESYKALEFTVQRLGRVAERLLQGVDIRLPEGGPDVATLAVELGTSSFRLSNFLHGEITADYQREAILAMSSYLAHYADG